jgi:hypothetical protein
MTSSWRPEEDGIRRVPQKLAEFGTDERTVQVDLRTPEGVEDLYRTVLDGGRVPAAAALNAGVGTGDTFLKTRLADALSSST